MFSGFMVNAWVVGTLVAAVAGVVGFFVVLRGSSFAAHAIPNGAFAGAAGAYLIGVNVLYGLGACAVLTALGIAGMSRRGRHDVATALALVTMLALGAMFLGRTTEYAQEIYSLLFGEILGVNTTELVPVAVLGALSVLAVVVLFRPLLLSTTLPDVADARGVSAGRMELLFLLVLALATTMTVPVVGAFLIFSLMIGPPALARAVTSRPAVSVVLSVVLAVATVWSAITLSYFTNWPIGFYVGMAGAVLYGAGRGWALVRDRLYVRVARGAAAAH